MRVMFIDSNPVLTALLPRGFEQAGFDVRVTRITSPQDLNSQLDRFKPHLIFTNGWGAEQTLDKQRWIRAATNRRRIPHVYWSIEDPLYTDHFVLPLLQASKPDFVFALSPQHVSFYRARGFRAAHLDWGIHPDLHRPVRPDPQYATDVALIANSYHRTIDQFRGYRVESMLQLLKPLIEARIRVSIWGEGWEQMDRFLGTELPRSWLKGPLPYSECNKAYCSAKIVLGLQNATTHVTQRTYEVLAAGGCLLTSDVAAVRKLFVPNRELLVTRSPDETVRLVKHYLKDPIRRSAIGAQGRTAVLRHSYVSRVGYIMDTITKAGIFNRA